MRRLAAELAAAARSAELAAADAERAAAERTARTDRVRAALEARRTAAARRRAELHRMMLEWAPAAAVAARAGVSARTVERVRAELLARL
jgi:uncharacterized protein (DUF111 family)